MKRWLFFIASLLWFPMNIFASDVANSDNVIQPNDIVIVWEEPKQKNRVLYYDVNESGDVVLCQKCDDSRTEKMDYLISVYSDEGIFSHGYIVSSYGTVKAKWNGDNIQILWVRKDAIAEMQEDGMFAKSYYVDSDTAEKEFRYTSHQKEGDKEYKIQWCGFNSLINSQLISIDKAGEKRVLYETNYQVTRIVIVVAFIIAVCIAAVYVCWHYYRENMNHSQASRYDY